MAIFICHPLWYQCYYEERVIPEYLMNRKHQGKTNHHHYTRGIFFFVASSSFFPLNDNWEGFWPEFIDVIVIFAVGDNIFLHGYLQPTTTIEKKYVLFCHFPHRTSQQNASKSEKRLFSTVSMAVVSFVLNFFSWENSSTLVTFQSRNFLAKHLLGCKTMRTKLSHHTIFFERKTEKKKYKTSQAVPKHNHNSFERKQHFRHFFFLHSLNIMKKYCEKHTHTIFFAETIWSFIYDLV